MTWLYFNKSRPVSHTIALGVAPGKRGLSRGTINLLFRSYIISSDHSTVDLPTTASRPSDKKGWSKVSIVTFRLIVLSDLIKYYRKINCTCRIPEVSVNFHIWMWRGKYYFTFFTLILYDFWEPDIVVLIISFLDLQAWRFL
jgi:hypothetical protein